MGNAEYMGTAATATGTAAGVDAAGTHAAADAAAAAIATGAAVHSVPGRPSPAAAGDCCYSTRSSAGDGIAIPDSRRERLQVCRPRRLRPRDAGHSDLLRQHHSRESTKSVRRTRAVWESRFRGGQRYDEWRWARHSEWSFQVPWLFFTELPWK